MILSKKLLKYFSSLTGSLLVTIVFWRPKRSTFSDKIPALSLLMSLAIIKPALLNLLAVKHVFPPGAAHISST